MQKILQVTAENFLSFRRENIRLRDLNILVGPNGAGKSNFLTIFSFIGDIGRIDLPAAIDRIGGYKQLRFRGIPFLRDRVRLEFEALITQHSSLTAPDRYALSISEFLPKISSDTSEERTVRVVRRYETIASKELVVQVGVLHYVKVMLKSPRSLRRFWFALNLLACTPYVVLERLLTRVRLTKLPPSLRILGCLTSTPMQRVDQARSALQIN